MCGQAFSQAAIDAAKALVGCGIAPGERVGIYSPNMREAMFTELGIFAARAVAVPLYATCSPDQVAFIAKKSSFRTLFVGQQYQYNNAYEVQSEQNLFDRIIIYDRKVVKQFNDHTSLYYDEFIRMGDSMRNETLVKERHGEALPSDLALLIYTSGTSGEPKGVQVLHSQILKQIENHHRLYPFITASDTSVDVLPLSHIFEKIWFYFCLSQGVRTAIVSDPRSIIELMPQIRPTLMCNVPRYWEKIYRAVRAHIEQSTPFMRWLYKCAIRTGECFHFDYYNKGVHAPIWISLPYWLYAHTIFMALKRFIGIEHGRFFPTAGAELNGEINHFLQSVGIPIIIGYGLSESCATVSAYPRRGFIPGSIGQIIPGLEVRIDPETQEIQLRGETITPGYFDNPEANMEAFTKDGWFRTGDAGRKEGDTLFFIERLKDLYKTANGKYIAPQQIENLLTADPYLLEVAVIADRHRFVSALIYPDWQLLKEKAVAHGIVDNQISIDEMANRADITRFLMSHIESLQTSLASFEKIKRISLLKAPFSVERGELTHTGKLRRKQINTNYALQIADMYREGDEQ